MGFFKDEKKYGKEAQEVSGQENRYKGIQKSGSVHEHMHIKTGVIDSLKDTVKFLKGK